MGRREKYEVTLRKGRRRNLPKKVLRHRNLEIKKGYSARASVWVADTPESNFMPTVNMTLSHNEDGVRLCFQNAADMVIFVENLRDFIGSLAVGVHERHAEAVQEFHEYHLGVGLPSLNDTTAHTVIQDLVVEKKTGEIVVEVSARKKTSS